MFSKIIIVVKGTAQKGNRSRLCLHCTYEVLILILLNRSLLFTEEASNTDPKLISGEESSNALAKPAKVDSHIDESLNLYPILTGKIISGAGKPQAFCLSIWYKFNLMFLFSEQVYPDNTNMISILESSFEFVKPSNVDSNNNSQYLNSVPSLPGKSNFVLTSPKY